MVSVRPSRRSQVSLSAWATRGSAPGSAWASASTTSTSPGSSASPRTCGGAFDGAAELVVVEWSEQDVVGGDGGGEPRVVGEMPVEVGAYGDEATRAVLDESVGEGGAFVPVVAQREELFELVDDERAGPGRWRVPLTGVRRV